MLLAALAAVGLARFSHWPSWFFNFVCGAYVGLLAARLSQQPDTVAAGTDSQQPPLDASQDVRAGHLLDWRPWAAKALPQWSIRRGHDRSSQTSRHRQVLHLVGGLSLAVAAISFVLGVLSDTCAEEGILSCSWQGASYVVRLAGHYWPVLLLSIVLASVYFYPGQSTNRNAVWLRRGMPWELHLFRCHG